MRLDKYILSLLPSFESSRLKEEIRLMREELVSNTLPPYTAALSVFARWKFNGTETQEFAKEFDRQTKTSFRGNYIQVTSEVLKRAVDNLTLCEALVDKMFSADITRDALSYRKANLLQYIDSIKFLIKYSRKLLHWTYVVETNKVQGSLDVVGGPLTPAEQKYLWDNRQLFFAAITNVGLKPTDVESKLDQVPDIVVNPDSADAVTRTVGASKLDPFRFGFISAGQYNPFRWIGERLAERDVEEYKQAVEERRVLEYRLLQMKQANEGKSDARLQQTIEYHENRLQKLNFAIAEMETSHA